jgi:glycosyltransferase involved in cell wall biosynthesis
MGGNIDSLVLIQAPLSRGYLAALGKLLGYAPQLLEVKQLRSLGMAGALRELWRLAPARLIVPIEDESAQHLLPVMQILAAASRAGALFVATPEGKLEPFSRWSVVPRMLQFALAAALNAVEAVSANLRLLWLQRQRRVPYVDTQLRRVLYINSNLWFGVKAGGSIGHVAGVINALLRRGYDVRSAACSPAPLLDPRAVNVTLRPQRMLAIPVELNNYRYHHRAVRQLRRYLRHNPPAFIYQRLSSGNFTGVELSRRFGVPLVTEYNGSEVWAQQHWGRPLAYPGLATRAEEVMLQHSHLVVTISDVLRRELADRGVAPERIASYPNCIDPAVFNPARFQPAQLAALRTRLGIAPDALVATFIGTFGRWHGVDVLAQAIRKMLDEEQPFLGSAHLHFVLVGDGLKMQEVRAALDHPLASQHVTLTGLVPQSEAPLYLAASDVLLSPHVENPDGTPFFGSPTKLFEYMAMGKAIIASDLDQIGEVLADSVRLDALPQATPALHESRVAVLCRPGSTQDIVSALHFLAGNPAWRARLGSNVRETALAKYTWDRHVQEILSGVERVARERGV